MAAGRADSRFLCLADRRLEGAAGWRCGAWPAVLSFGRPWADGRLFGRRHARTELRERGHGHPRRRARPRPRVRTHATAFILGARQYPGAARHAVVLLAIAGAGRA